MSTADKLNKLIETKEAIRQSIISKGTDVGEDVPFSQYPSKINEIQTGTVEGDPFVQEFYNMKINNSNWDYLFGGCSGDLDLTKLNTSHVNSMESIFQNTGGNIDCSNWNLSNVGSLHNAFYNSSANLNISGWDLSNASNCSYFLQYFQGNIDISDLKLGDNCSVYRMFAYANLGGITGIQDFKLPANIYDLSGMFCGVNEPVGSGLDLSNWNVPSRVCNYSSMFSYSNLVKLDLTGWTTINNSGDTPDVGSMFESMNNLEELIIPDFDLTDANGYDYMFGWDSSEMSNFKYIDISRCNADTVSKIVQSLPTKHDYNFGEIVLPEGTSEDIINTLLGKFWKPKSYSSVVSSCNISTKYDQILVDEPLKVNINNVSPWYANHDSIEFVSTNDSVLTIDSEGNINALTLGSSDVYAITKDTKQIVSNTLTINVVEEYTVSNVFKFRTNGNSPMYYRINEVELTGENCSYDDASGIWTYDPGENVTRAYSSYYGDSNITEIINLDPTHIYSFDSLFWYCCSLRDINMQNWTNIDLSSITTLRNTFYYCYSLTELDLSNWNLGAIDSLYGTFQDCRGLTTLNIANWELNPTYCEVVDVFANCYNLRSITCNVASTINRLIEHLPGTNGTIYTTCNPAELDLNYISNMGWTVESSYVEPPADTYPIQFKALDNTGSFTVNDNTINVADCIMSGDVYMYNPGTEITKVQFTGSNITELVNLDTSNVTNADNMFAACRLLTEFNVHLDTSRITNMWYMFGSCENLRSINISNWNTTNVSSMSSMFTNCYSLETLDARNINLAVLESTYWVLDGCSNFAELRLDNCDNITISKFITLINNSTYVRDPLSNGSMRKIYCKEENASGLTAPSNWEFVFVTE